MSNGSLLCQPPGTGYRPDLDGLRAIAVLAVVAYHAFPEQAPGGYVGVDVFFVISGFLITNIILDALSRHGFRLREFYARRARRILPALCLVLATCLAFGCYVLLPDEFSNLSKHTAAAAGFAANIAFWRESGYFAPAAQFEPLLHLWSLGIEEQFYLLWPLLLLLAWRLRWHLVPTVALLGAASFALNVIMTNRQATGLYYFPFSRFWELAVGCLLASARVRVASARAVPAAADSPGARASTSRVPARIPGALANAVAIAGVALIAIAAFGFDAHTPFPGFAALVPIAGASCIVAAPGSWFRERVLSHPWLVFVGLVSYPLYLWHWPILSFAAILHAGTPEIGVRVAGLALSFVLAVLTYRLLELPIRKRRRPSVSVALAGAAAALGLAGVAIY
ncbi:MAG TPA: acyltransferase, partial [Steroidobacteraceae bacterium]|nr:acyltransferase [Steroidobacteraceae bacterium]